MKLTDFKEKYDKLQVKCNLSGKEALKAVEQNGDSLQYVKECMFLIKEEMIEIDGKLIPVSAFKYAIKKILKI